MSKEFEGNVKKFALKNKLTYYICNNKMSTEKLRLALIVKAGSLMEQDMPNGVAHFTEHLCIENGIEYLKEVDRYYEDNNILQGYTNFEQTVYYFDCNIDNIDDGLIVLKNILLYCSNNNLLMKKVKEKLIIELDHRMKCDDFTTKCNILPTIACDKDIMSKFPLGKKSCIEKMKFQQVKDFHDKWYKLKNSAICVCGNIENINIKEKIDKYFSEINDDSEKNEEYKINCIPYEQKIVINNNSSAFKVQFYYLKRDYKYNLKADITEYFLFMVIKNYILDYFTKNNLVMVEFYSKVFLNNLKFNILEFKSKNEFKDKFKFVDKIINVINSIKINAINENGFIKYKKSFLENMKYFYTTENHYDNREIIKECVNNFIYDEELMTLDNEYEVCNSIIKNMYFEEFNKLIHEEMDIKNLVLVIDGKGEINSEYIDRFKKIFR
ncbi:M16 family metallopeptidase [Clostridium felsineum]|uniref:M16 family metallopeptidase n=1 Tax=Clostridium felsineum TaxID=36839 RepID=UPI00098BEA1B|nr:pitrilysin family protein [Clostridium felsineum]URZ01768.1 hypothetical protein CLAUR_017640 [Clostridium felsineum]